MFGKEGTILRLDPDTGEMTRLNRPPGSESVWYSGAVALSDGSFLVYGDESAVVRLDLGTNVVTRFAPPSEESMLRFNAGYALPDGRAILLSEGNSLVRFDPPSGRERTIGALTQLDFPTGMDRASFDRSITLADGGALVYGSSGGTVRLDATTGRASLLPPPAKTESVTYRGSLVLKSREVLLYGDEGAIVLFDPSTNAMIRIDNLPGTSTVWYNGALELDDGAVIVYGDEGTVVRLDRTSWAPSRFTAPESSARVVFLGAVAHPGGKVIVFGDEGTVAEVDLATLSLLPFARPVGTERVRYTGALVRSEQSTLIYGDQGTIASLDVVNRSLVRLASPQTWFDRTITSMIDIGKGGVMLILEGNLPGIRFGVLSDRYAREVGQIEPLTDENIETFLTDGLPAGVRDGDAVVALRPVQAGIAAQTDLAEKTLSQAEEAEKGLWTGTLLVQDERLAFREFMKDCRGEKEPSGPSAAEVANQITIACTAAWQADLKAKEGSAWQTLAETVPPGVLLLFLLGTLSGLYRYNLRLAGFHDSRADALELLSLARSDDEIREALDNKNTDVLMRIATALAADKVAFAAGRDPTDQAVDLAKGILSRS